MCTVALTNPIQLLGRHMLRIYVPQSEYLSEVQQSVDTCSRKWLCCSHCILRHADKVYPVRRPWTELQQRHPVCTARGALRFRPLLHGRLVMSHLHAGGQPAYLSALSGLVYYPQRGIVVAQAGETLRALHEFISTHAIPLAVTVPQTPHARTLGSALCFGALGASGV